MRCNQCEMLAINGTACHEIGCPEAWRGTVRECKECGCSFAPDCADDFYCTPCCRAVFLGLECDCDGCRDDRADARQAGAAFDEWHGVLSED